MGYESNYFPTRVVLLHYYNGVWSYYPPPTGVGENWDLSGLHFTSPNEGWAVGYDGPNVRGALLHYYYGTWTVIEPPEFSGRWRLNDVYFISSNEGWAVGESWDNSGIHQGVLLKYINGSWSFDLFPLSPTPIINGCFPKSIYFASPNDGWIIGNCDAKGFLLKYIPGPEKNVTDTVQKIFIGYYQRPADPGGLIYWAGRLNASGGNLTDIIEAFANSAESQALYGTINSSNISTVVNGIYKALFCRSAEAAGLNYYVNGFNSGQFTAATIMLNILNGAQNEDRLSVNNKLTASMLFTTAIDPDLDGMNFQATYSGDIDAQKARDFLSTVCSNPVTIPTQADTTLFIKNNIADPGDPILNP